MTNPQPTPRPWSMVSGSNTIVIYNDKLLRQIAYLYGGADHSEANAAHIVHCVNTFDALLEAADELIEKVVSMTQSVFMMDTEENVWALVERDRVVAKARDAIQKARGK